MAKQAALVTGASKGIGLATIRQLAREGHKVVGISRTPPPEGTPCEFVSVDLSDAKATEAALADITARYDITRLLNNAGIPVPDKAGEITLDGLDLVMAVNLRAAIQCMQACLPAMKRNKLGRIVNISSRSILGKPGRSAYSAAKAALVGLSRTWALEVGKHGITVNVIAPGAIMSELFVNNNPQSYLDRLAAESPVGRLGTPEDTANAICFFLSEAAGYVTGQTLHVCGGLSVGSYPS